MSTQPAKPEATIVTTFVYPPIPVRCCDWQAHYGDDEPNDDGQMDVGRGSTEHAAIRDLLDNHPRTLSYRATITATAGLNRPVIRAIARSRTEYEIAAHAAQRIPAPPLRILHRQSYRWVLGAACDRRNAEIAARERAALPAAEQFCRALELEIWKRRNKLGPSDREHADDQRKIAEYEATIARVRASMAAPVLQAAE